MNQSSDLIVIYPQKFLTTSTLTLLELQAAIIREPLVVPADATVMEAIALMSIGRSQCDAENYSDNHQQQFQQEARSSCVLVLEDEKLIGIVTERDVVRLSAQRQDLDRLLVREVMAHPVVTMRESDLTDLFLAVNLLQQYRIRHLPLLDDQDLLVGMLTHESLRQISRPIDLMRLRLVSEVMTSDVVCAAPENSMLAIAQLMAEQKISSVMIVEPSITDPSLQIPVGIVTERDVVQFQALGLNLETCMAHTVMSTPIFSVKPENNLLAVQQIMEQRLIRRLAVTGEFGELLGIVTQTNLLQALNPTEIYNLAKVLEAKVEQLESEKVTLLENRNVDLESQVKERTASLLEAEKALQQLNQSLEVKVQERTQEVQLQAQMLEQIHDAVISTALDGTILAWNIGAEILYEYKSDEAIGQNVSMLYLAEDLPLMESEVFSPLIEKGTHEVELRHRTKSGNIIYISLRLSVVWDAMGNPIRLIGCSNNISDSKQAENALRESQALLQTVLDAFPLSVFWKDRQSVILGCNQLFAMTCGLKSPLEAIGKSDFDFDCTEDEALAYSADDQKIMESGLAKLNIEEQITLASGEQQWLQTNKIPLRDAEGNVIGVMGTFQDISDRKVAEKTLKQQLAAIEAAIDGIAILQNNKYIYLNQAHLEIFGYDHPDELLGKSWTELYSSEELARFEQEVFPVLQRDRSWQGEAIAIRKNGSAFDEELSLTTTDTGLLICVCRNISDRKQSELQLQNATERLALALNSGAIGCWEWDIQQNFLVWDDRMYELYGYSQETYSHLPYEIWSDTIHPDDREVTESILQQAVLGQVEYDCEFRVIYPDCSIHFIKAYGKIKRDTQGKAESMVGVNFDISDRKQAELIILQQANRETLLRGITQRIRQSLDLSIIFDTACQEIQQLLQCDRVGIFKFYPESNFDDGEFVAESVVEGFSSAMEVHIHDHCFGEGYAAAYAQGRIQVVNDIDNAGLMDCHRDVLAQFQIRANLVIPLLCGNSLWGLLCIHQCAHTRQWQEHEINLIQQIANQLAIAIQQASLYEQLQEELLIRQQSQLKIAQQLRQQQTLATITNKIRESLSIKEILAVVTQQVKDVLSSDRVIVFQLFDNGNSQIVEESVHSNFPNLKDLNWEDEVWSQEILDCYWQGKPRIVPDVMNDIWTECLVEYSIEGQIKSKIIAPILLEPHINENHRWVATEGSKKLWGVLVVHACAEPREWQDSEAQLLQQIANQLAIAIQQASLYEQVQADLSIRKQTEIQLLKVNDELLRATKLKDEFLANMSHELRTPLNSILGLSNALGEQLLGSLNEKQTKAIGTVESSGEHLLSLINDILDLSKISSGMMELNAESVSVKNLCDSSLVFVKQQAFKKQVQLNSNIPKNINNINVEERRIRQVLINLLTNAVKFTPSKGQVNLLIAVGKGDTWQGGATIPQRIKLMNSPMIVFQVVDTGIGIAPNDLQRLFQPFVQVSSSLNRQYEGTGLGLALVKQIVELHGGQVMAESELGKGSSFSVALPYEMSQSSAPESTTVSTTLPPVVIDPDHAPLILLAEDNEANIQTFTSYLTAINYRIVVARNGIEAVAMAKSESPDIIIMDIQMPGMDGLEAIRLIRADESIAAIPIIALTALAMEGDRERCLKAGANEYLAKPIKFRQLNTAIQQILTDD